MRVKLTQDIMENGKIKASSHFRPGRPTVEFRKGAEIDMSDASGKKYIKNGWAKEVKVATSKKRSKK